MPPNRKGAFDAVDTLATLNVSQFVNTAKYQPLTTSAGSSTVVPAATQDATPEPQQPETDPAKKALIERILVEERLREQFSADHVIQLEANRHDEGEEKTEVNNDDADDYWAMTTPSDLSTDIHSKRTNESYWDWQTKTPQQEKNDLINAILEQERVRQLFSVDHMVQKIQEEASTVQKKESLLPQNDSYWEWNEQVDNDLQPDKAEIIQHIMEAERLRQQFSAAALEEKLVQQAAKGSSVEDVSRVIPSNDDYWAGF